MKLVLDMAMHAPIFVGKGDKTQLNRWFQFTNRWRQFETWASVLLLIIVSSSMLASTCLGGHVWRIAPWVVVLWG